jgi:protein gp37
MGDQTGIEWTDATWNPVTGCSKVSPGCAHCYAETLALGRLAGKPGYPGLPWTPENAAANVNTRPDRLDQPIRWRRPRMVFVNSMSDLFHELVPDRFVAEVFAVMALAEHHTFQVLTKRPERMRALLNDLMWWAVVEGSAQRIWAERHHGQDPSMWLAVHGPLPNVWLGTSIENRRYIHRADLLRETPAAVRFISAEPLLGPLVRYDGPELDLTGIDWLIVGGESGPEHRPMREEWVRDLRDACVTSGPLAGHTMSGSQLGLRVSEPFHHHRTSFFFKQDSGPRSGSRGRFVDEHEWPREMPRGVSD